MIRYRFGDNWARYTKRMPVDALSQAVSTLRLQVGEITGYSFLDVGSGSGLMSAAALHMGGGPLLAFDVDPHSVDTTRHLLEAYAPGEDWQAKQGDVLRDDFGEWDVVYAWGVLHHTGDLRTALRRAASWVSPGGRYVVAIYLKTPMCGFWTSEKRWYSQAPTWLRAPVRWIYMAGLLTVWILKGRIRERLGSHHRGMTFRADVDDWLGGYPYESLTFDEIKTVVEPLGFEAEAEFPLADHMGRFGTGCQTIRFRSTGRG